MRRLHRRLARWTVSLMVLLVTNAHAVTFELRGVGTLPSVGTPPAGIPGEVFNVTVRLDSSDFVYLSIGSPVVHYFLPTITIPVEIVGSLSGEYPDVSPIERFVALELENSPSQGDKIGLDVTSGSNGTSLFSLNTVGVSGFDGDLTPYTSAQLFALFAEAMRSEGMWQKSSSSAVFIGSSGDVLFLGNTEWSLLTVNPGDFDADGDVDGRDFLEWQRKPNIGVLANWQANYGVKHGDFDFDGDVDGRDFLLWQRNPSIGSLVNWQAAYGANAYQTHTGDFDADGGVDGRDFLLWQRNPSVGSLADWQVNYGAGSPIAASSSVPEPTYVRLFAIGAVLSVVCRELR